MDRDEFSGGFTRHAVSRDGVRLHYRAGGPPDGDPVLLWHGFLGTGFVWRKVAPLLARTHRVLVPDMRGYGDSDKPPGPNGYDGRTLVADFRAVARDASVGDRPLWLVAHDMGAPPALLWAADYPKEVRGLAYLDEPACLPDVLAKLISFTPETTKLGGLWWWPMALAPDAAERLVVGREREFLTWSYDHYTADRAAIEPAAVDEYLRSFRGRDGVSGAFGVYRAIFQTVGQTAPLAEKKVRVPVLALGGEKSMGGQVREMLERVANDVSGGTMPGCGHFIPEEKPAELADRLIEFFRSHDA